MAAPDRQHVGSTRYARPMDESRPAPTITCVDCLGTCHLISFEPPEGWEPGDVLVYRCADCLDRWDLVWEPEADEAAD
jgi:hypothetical protein